MRKQLVVLMLTALGCGCAAPRTTVPAVEATTVGTIVIERSLIQSGGATEDELAVTPGRYGGAIITVGKGEAEAISLYLPRSAMESYADHLGKLATWGETARQGKIDTVKSVGSITCQAEPSGRPAIIGTRFISSRGGEAWIGQSRFCQLHAASGGNGSATPPPGSNLCARESTFYLRPAAARALLEILTRRSSAPAR